MKEGVVLNCSKVRVANIEVEVRTAGTQGRKLLFLHPGDGLEGDNAALEDLAGRYNLIAPSHPGFGQSELPGHYRKVEDLAYFYLDFLEEQDLRDVVLVGVSFGAWIAAQIAIMNSSRVAGLVLASAVGAKFGDRMSREITDIFSLPLYEHPPLLHANPALAGMNYKAAPEDKLLRLARNYESFALFGWSPTLHDPQLARRLHRIKVPTTFIWGEKDRIVPVDYGRKFAAAVPGAKFEVIAGAGHHLHADNPEAFTSAVDTFMKALPKAA
jgi:pimeloyl-ACP methyl ester carboxylesterase